MFDSDIKISGKHASYIKFLSSKSLQLNKNITCAGIFKRYIDVYIAGAVIGMVKKLKSSTDNSIEDSANILASAVIGEQAKLKILYRIMQLIDQPSLSADERIDFAFRYDTDDAHVKNGMELFNAYVRGGIEWIYEEITSNATTNDDFLERLANMVKDFSQDYDV